MKNLELKIHNPSFIMLKMRSGKIFFVLFFVSSTYLEGSKIGVGFIIGEPTGFTLKFKSSSLTSFKFSAAWSLGNYFHLHGDFIHYFPFKIKNYGENWSYYAGIGGKWLLKRRRNPHLGLRIPLGIAYRGSVIDSFFEIVPVMEIFPETKLDFDLAIGFHYHFYPP